MELDQLPLQVALLTMEIARVRQLLVPIAEDWWKYIDERARGASGGGGG
jgi:hypothetical protein